MDSNKTKSAAWEKQRSTDDDDDISYLSRETIRRREDQKLKNYITSALYRLELENIKPSFEVKLQTGLHRGPYKSKRGRRSHLPSSAPVAPDSGRSRLDATGRPLSFEPPAVGNASHQPKLPGAGLASASGYPRPSGSRSWTPTVENHYPRVYEDPYYLSTVDGYATLPRRWMRELAKIEEDNRRLAISSSPVPPPLPPTVKRHNDTDELLSYLKEPVITGSAAAGHSYFEDDISAERLRQLLDTPFVGRNHVGYGSWGTHRSAEPGNNYYNMRHSTIL